jgi:ABC-type transporter Mla subunit MlaD
MAESTSLNSIRAGIFVGASLLLLSAIAFVLSKTDFSRKNEYMIRFTTTEGVSGLNVGSDVRVGGMLAGKVVAVMPDLPKDGEALRFIDVKISLNSDMTLYWSPKPADLPRRGTVPDAQWTTLAERHAQEMKLHGEAAMAMRVASLLGNSASINFIRIGSPPAALVKPLNQDPTSRIMAFEGGGMLAALVGPDNAQKARQMLNEAADTMAYINEKLPEAYERDIAPMLSNANTMVADIRTSYSERWRGNIDSTLQSAAGAVTRADKLLTDNDPAIRQVLADAAKTLENTRQMTGELSEKGMPKLLAMLDDGASAADSLSKALEQVREAMTSSLPSLKMFLDDSRQVAAQLKLAAIEVRHSPWKLLYQPKEGEVAHENLYDASRSFALATDDLRAAGETLKQAVDRMPGKMESDAAFRTRIQREVLDAMGRYEEAQRHLYDVLNAPASEGGEKR